MKRRTLFTVLVSLQLLIAPRALAQQVPVTTAASSNSSSTEQSAPTPVNMDLNSTVASVAPPKMLGDQTVSINVGGTPKNVTSASVLTPAERMAVYQVLSSPSGQQSLLLGAQGNAIGGSFNIGPKFSQYVSSLAIPQNVTAIKDATSSSVLNLSGNLVNAGSVYVLSNTTGAATIAANSIYNQVGGLISTVAPAGNLAGIGNVNSMLDLNLTSVTNIINSGRLISSGALNLTAGGAIVNALPNGVIGTQPLMQASGAINLVSGAGAIHNHGIINSLNSNININSIVSQSILVNNLAGTMHAANGTINVRDVVFSDKKDLTFLGGDVISKELNLNAGEGNLRAELHSITGQVNAHAGFAEIGSQTGNLNLGNITITGDPIFYSLGDLVLSGDLLYGNEPLSLWAQGNVIFTGNQIKAGTLDVSAGYKLDVREMDIVNEDGNWQWQNVTPPNALPEGVSVEQFNELHDTFPTLKYLTVSKTTIVANDQANVMLGSGSISGNYVTINATGDVQLGNIADSGRVGVRAGGQVSVGDVSAKDVSLEAGKGLDAGNVTSAETALVISGGDTHVGNISAEHGIVVMAGYHRDNLWHRLPDTAGDVTVKGTVHSTEGYGYFEAPKGKISIESPGDLNLGYGNGSIEYSSYEFVAKDGVSLTSKNGDINLFASVMASCDLTLNTPTPGKAVNIFGGPTSEGQFPRGHVFSFITDDVYENYGPGGNVIINTSTLRTTNQTMISASSKTAGSGNVIINAQNILAGSDMFVWASGAFTYKNNEQRPVENGAGFVAIASTGDLKLSGPASGSLKLNGANITIASATNRAIDLGGRIELDTSKVLTDAPGSNGKIVIGGSIKSPGDLKLSASSLQVKSGAELVAPNMLIKTSVIENDGNLKADGNIVVKSSDESGLLMKGSGTYSATGCNCFVATNYDLDFLGGKFEGPTSLMALGNNGSVLLKHSIETNGHDLAIVASKDIISLKSDIVLNTSSSIAKGGDITLIAGAQVFAPFIVPSETGGSIDLHSQGAVTQLNASSSVGNGGNIILDALGGSINTREELFVASGERPSGTAMMLVVNTTGNGAANGGIYARLLNTDGSEATEFAICALDRASGVVSAPGPENRGPVNGNQNAQPLVTPGYQPSVNTHSNGAADVSVDVPVIFSSSTVLSADTISSLSSLLTLGMPPMAADVSNAAVGTANALFSGDGPRSAAGSDLFDGVDTGSIAEAGETDRSFQQLLSLLPTTPPSGGMGGLMHSVFKNSGIGAMLVGPSGALKGSGMGSVLVGSLSRLGGVFGGSAGSMLNAAGSTAGQLPDSTTSNTAPVRSSGGMFGITRSLAGAFKAVGIGSIFAAPLSRLGGITGPSSSLFNDFTP